MNSKPILSACAAIAALASLGGCPSALGQEVHYSPEEDLAQIDAQLDLPSIRGSDFVQ
jgi:hypothetical protein